MFAVVLVGGFGTRLRPLTNEIPKPMLPVLHRPMITRLVERLEQGGVTDVVLALGFKPEPFQSAFPESVHNSVRIHYAVEPEPLDTAGAIAFAARAAGVDDTFVVANGDIITSLSIGDLVAAHRRADAAATLHLIPVDDPSAYGVVEVDDARIRRFVEKPAPGESDSNLINAGTYVFEPGVLDLIPPLERWSVERAVFPEIASRGDLAGYATDDEWLDAGRPEAYLGVNVDLARRHPDEAVHPSALVRPGAVIVDSVIGPDVVVGAGATVVSSLLFGHATVAADATVERSVVMGSVGIGATVTDSVIGERHRVSAGDRVDGARLPETVS
ncbi:MAG: NDP-sugar synthase [Ilumatobacter sp.]|nr:NDP-sugar synthase [Ilumatobacter sp.]